MEKKFIKRIRNSGKIVITGPESTGKTDLAMHLASVFNGKYIPEYAREYVSKLSRPYQYNDVLNIAAEQIRQQEEAEKWKGDFVFFDTWLIITKIWFREVYGNFPVWINEKIKSTPIDLFLLCAPDIPWEPDLIRENGGEKRNYFFDQYKKEIINLGSTYKIVTGTGQERFDLAEIFINEHFNLI